MKCTECKRDFSCIKKYIVHIEYAHKVANYYKCPINSCHRLYNRRDTFKKHVITNHSEHIVVKDKFIGNVTSPQTKNPSKSATGEKSCSDDSTNNTNIFDINAALKKFNDVLQKAVIHFIAKFYDDLSFNRSMIQDIIIRVGSLMKSGVFDIIKDCCSQIFGNIENTKDNLNGITNMINMLENLFDPLNTDYKRIKYFNDSNMLIKPIEQILGVTYQQKKENNEKIMALKNNYSYFVPMRQSLKTFLEIPKVFKTILNYQQKLLDTFNEKKSCMAHLVHGSLWRKLRSLFPDDQIVFPLIVYFDDFEPLNPIGSHAGSYKIGSVYYSIGTVPSEYSSRLENIFLALLFYSGDRLHFGNKKTFDIIIKELTFLEKVGINITTDENVLVNVKFCLVALTGDNLGVHTILGLNESFSSTHYCRFCIDSKTNMNNQTVENPRLIRIKDQYEEHFENKLGIKELCIWNEIPSFHIYENFCCDLMHDIFEGVLRYDMAVIVSKLIRETHFNLERLNSRIKYFTFSKCEKNICSEIKKHHLSNDGCIIMSAAEMLNLTRNFAFIIGDLVPQGNKIWKFYLVVLEMVHIITSTAFTSETLQYLSSLIKVHNEEYMNISGQHLKPKFHFLVHYPRIIEKIGPPILLSCMRFEAKHKDLKNVSHTITCRKNLPLSLASRNQQKFCYRLMASEGFNNKINFGKIDDIDEDQRIILQSNFLQSGQFFCTHFYELNGVRYDINAVMWYKEENDIPIFFQIKNIYVDKTNSMDIYFYGLLLESVNYSEHFYAYKVKESNIVKVLKVAQLSSEFPTILHKVKDDCFVTKFCTG